MERRLRGEACSAHARDLMPSSDLWGNKHAACRHTDTHDTQVKVIQALERETELAISKAWQAFQKCGCPPSIHRLPSGYSRFPALVPTTVSLHHKGSTVVLSPEAEQTRVPVGTPEPRSNQVSFCINSLVLGICYNPWKTDYNDKKTFWQLEALKNDTW